MVTTELDLISVPHYEAGNPVITTGRREPLHRTDDNVHGIPYGGPNGMKPRIPAEFVIKLWDLSRWDCLRTAMALDPGWTI